MCLPRSWTRRPVPSDKVGVIRKQAHGKLRKVTMKHICLRSHPHCFHEILNKEDKRCRPFCWFDLRELTNDPSNNRKCVQVSEDKRLGELKQSQNFRNSSRKVKAAQKGSCRLKLKKLYCRQETGGYRLFIRDRLQARTARRQMKCQSWVKLL